MPRTSEMVHVQLLGDAAKYSPRLEFTCTLLTCMPFASPKVYSKSAKRYTRPAVRGACTFKQARRKQNCIGRAKLPEWSGYGGGVQEGGVPTPA